MSFMLNRATMLLATTMGAAALAIVPAMAQVKTIEPGKLNIAMNGDMPMTQLKDGVLGGTDGELMVYIAKKLGLEPIRGLPNLGGPIVTASGLVFIAAATDNKLRAFDGRDKGACHSSLPLSACPCSLRATWGAASN